MSIRSQVRGIEAKLLVLFFGCVAEMSRLPRYEMTTEASSFFQRIFELKSELPVSSSRALLRPAISIGKSDSNDDLSSPEYQLLEL
jgi:hypothetical protein